MSLKKSWDFQARWKGKLTKDDLARLNAWLKQEKWLHDVEVKLGLTRNRINVRFARPILKNQMEKDFEKVKSLMEENGQPDEVQSALQELMNVKNEGIKAELIKSYLTVLVKNKSQHYATVLGALIPAECNLSISLAAVEDIQW